MAPRETGKERSQRIQIDYYRHRGGLFWLRWVCILAGLIGAGLYAAYVSTPAGSQHVSTGPLAVAHASFESNCQQCHQDFTPLSDDAFRIHPDQSIQHTEQACQECHRKGDHHRDVLSADWKLIDQNCAHCHTDHMGRDHDLTKVTNQRCVQCHANVKEVCNPGHVVTSQAEIAQFTLESHGDFRSLSDADPGRIKFDHGQHMQPGQVAKGTKGGFTLEMLEPSKRGQYQKASDSPLVQLECANCHQRAGNPELKSRMGSDAEIGRYMKPVSFDDHCSACHSINALGRTESTLAVPHAAPWAEVDLWLRTKITGQRSQTPHPGNDSQSNPLPGVRFNSADGRLTSVSDEEVANARQLVRKQCEKCHDKESLTDQAIADSLSGKSEPLVPTRWLTRGLFDHSAHTKVACRHCHQEAYADAGVVNVKPMIGGIETCIDCHRSPDSPEPQGVRAFPQGQPTWASDSCILCHRYHSTEAK